MLRKKICSEKPEIATLSTSAEEPSFEKSERLQVVNYFRKKSQSLIFDKVLNTFLKTRKYS